MVVLLTCKNEEDPIKTERARVLTRCSHILTIGGGVSCRGRRQRTVPVEGGGGRQRRVAVEGGGGGRQQRMVPVEEGSGGCGRGGQRRHKGSRADEGGAGGGWLNS